LRPFRNKQPKKLKFGLSVLAATVVQVLQDLF